MNMRAKWYFGLLLCCSQALWGAADVMQVTASSGRDRVSLFFSLNGTFTYKTFTLPNPDRVVIDFNDTRLKTALNQLNAQNPLIRQVRSGVSPQKTLRVVLEVTQKVRAQATPWTPKDGLKGVRIDLITSAPVAAPVSAAGTKPHVYNPVHKAPLVQTHRPTPPPVMKPVTPVKTAHLPPQRLRDVIVVLDAGHGGKDPGAHGPRHSKEKDVVLAITLRLKRLIDSQPGMRAVLTRSGDYYVGLRQRMDIARKYNGDIFVSIHADAFNNPMSNGASVFALSQSGATSEAARWLAEKENYSELGGVNLGDLDDHNGVVRSVLIDLSQTATINAGLQMGQRVLGQLGSLTTLHNHKVEQARFMVLKSPDIPSILVETGFISNPREERNLTSPGYQDRLSRAIFQGIKGYFWDNPPHGSRIEQIASRPLPMAQISSTSRPWS